MGRAFYLLSTIPSKGERKSLDLYSHSAKTKLGSVMIDLRIRGLREGLSSAEALAEHLRLTRAVVDSESKVVRVCVRLCGLYIITTRFQDNRVRRTTKYQWGFVRVKLSYEPALFITWWNLRSYVACYSKLSEGREAKKVRSAGMPMGMTVI